MRIQIALHLRSVVGGGVSVNTTPGADRKHSAFACGGSHGTAVTVRFFFFYKVAHALLFGAV